MEGPFGDVGSVFLDFMTVMRLLYTEYLEKVRRACASVGNNLNQIETERVVVVVFVLLPPHIIYRQLWATRQRSLLRKS